MVLAMSVECSRGGISFETTNESWHCAMARAPEKEKKLARCKNVNKPAARTEQADDVADDVVDKAVLALAPDPVEGIEEEVEDRAAVEKGWVAGLERLDDGEEPVEILGLDVLPERFGRGHGEGALEPLEADGVEAGDRAVDNLVADEVVEPGLIDQVERAAVVVDAKEEAPDGLGDDAVLVRRPLGGLLPDAEVVVYDALEELAELRVGEPVVLPLVEEEADRLDVELLDQFEGEAVRRVLVVGADHGIVEQHIGDVAKDPMGDEQALERAGHCETKTIRSWIRMENEQGGEFTSEVEPELVGLLDGEVSVVIIGPPPVVGAEEREEEESAVVALEGALLVVVQRAAVGRGLGVLLEDLGNLAAHLRNDGERAK